MEQRVSILVFFTWSWRVNEFCMIKVPSFMVIVLTEDSTVKDVMLMQYVKLFLKRLLRIRNKLLDPMIVSWTVCLFVSFLNNNLSVSCLIFDIGIMSWNWERGFLVKLVVWWIFPRNGPRFLWKFHNLSLLEMSLIGSPFGITNHFARTCFRKFYS